MLDSCFQVRLVWILFGLVSGKYYQVNVFIGHFFINFIGFCFFLNYVYSKNDPILSRSCVRNIDWKFDIFDWYRIKVRRIKFREVEASIFTIFIFLLEEKFVFAQRGARRSGVIWWFTALVLLPFSACFNL